MVKMLKGTWTLSGDTGEPWEVSEQGSDFTFASDAATLRAEGRKDWQVGNKRDQGRAWGGDSAGWSWREKDLHEGGRGTCQAGMANWMQKVSQSQAYCSGDRIDCDIN